MDNRLDAAFLREQAQKCLRLAKSIFDPEARASLRNMAALYESRARRLDEANSPPN